MRPQVIEDAKEHGLVLGKNSRLYDGKKGQKLPEGTPPMPVLTADELKAIPETPVRDVVRNYVARYWDLMALAKAAPCAVIGPEALLKDKPGFEVDLITRGSIPEASYSTPRHEILMVVRGHWKLGWTGGETALAPGDTCAVPPGLSHSLAPSMSGEASMFRVRNTDDPAGRTWNPSA